MLKLKIMCKNKCFAVGTLARSLATFRTGPGTTGTLHRRPESPHCEVSCPPDKVVTSSDKWQWEQKVAGSHRQKSASVTKPTQEDIALVRAVA